MAALFGGSAVSGAALDSWAQSSEPLDGDARLRSAEALKQSANDAFTGGRSGDALQMYFEALWHLRDGEVHAFPAEMTAALRGDAAAPMLGDKGESAAVIGGESFCRTVAALRRSLHLNVATVALKLEGQLELALAAALRVSQAKCASPAETHKARLRAAAALERLGRGDEAAAALEPLFERGAAVDKPLLRDAQAMRRRLVGDAPPPAAKESQIKMGFLAGASLAPPGGDNRPRAPGPPPTAFAAPSTRAAMREEEQRRHADFANNVDAMRRAGVGDDEIKKRIGENFDGHADDVQKGAAAVGLMLQMQGKSDIEVANAMREFLEKNRHLRGR
ncbi:hypothetical protein M885DRAFT_510933 [Pelagophyceae sp. CCMP2097]|nr:hypothetical protein M885DRAFT_510933 [Pelagophyceae sp. CCMP2097]|mmetsp:Transcript_6543/g.22991  ORF Transcript_6543/g.22991 Transcript_6543/m.22991 type:complete len:334 (-) Transcript_6543:43-1044(-)